MAKIVDNSMFRSVLGTGIKGEEVRLAALRKDFERADYAPATCPPRLIELQDVGSRKAGSPQTVACFYEVGERPGQSRVVKVPVIDKVPDIVAALTQAGFSAPPVKTTITTQVRRLIAGALHLSSR